MRVEATVSSPLDPAVQKEETTVSSGWTDTQGVATQRLALPVMALSCQQPLGKENSFPQEPGSRFHEGAGDTPQAPETHVVGEVTWDTSFHITASRVGSLYPQPVHQHIAAGSLPRTVATQALGMLQEDVGPCALHGSDERGHAHHPAVQFRSSVSVTTSTKEKYRKNSEIKHTFSPGPRVWLSLYHSCPPERLGFS
ncbi:hypothetical protein HJG60_009282 [Phyllostomus discolor]|uniref:Uncharacterized protein n=1 Tax=Phyllostomus discolor TaxID=89673 RepID=A0A833YMR5_9CHIR|nr:hypothetical protein HJG60_009282 [Phyllostomus discolor]